MREHPVSYSPQVRDYIAALEPGIKKRFRAEIKKLSLGGGDHHALKPPLDGFRRLAIGTHRVIYTHVAPATLYCVYAGPRKTIYETFAPLPRLKKDRGLN